MALLLCYVFVRFRLCILCKRLIVVTIKVIYMYKWTSILAFTLYSDIQLLL